MDPTRRGLLIGTAAAALLVHQTRAHILVGTGAPIPPTQNIASIAPATGSFIAGSGSANTPIATMAVTMSPASPAFAGTFSLSPGGSGSGFVINPTTGLLSVGSVDVAPGSYSFSVIATQAGIANSPFSQPVVFTGTSVSTTLSAEISFPGGTPTGATVIFDMTAGTDIGNYVAPSAGFTQRCVRVRNAALTNFFVDFRPDLTGGRVEAVFWNGEVDPTNMTVPSGFVRNLPVYDVVIKNAGTPIYSARIPLHYWACRWRYQSAVRPVIRTGAQVFSDGFFPPMTTHAARLTGLNESTGQPWSGLPYSGVIVPPTPAAVAAYTPFGPPNPARVSTTLSSGSPAGATSINLTSTAGFGAFDIIAIALSDGTHLTTRMPTNTNPCTIELPLPVAANAGAVVYAADFKSGLLLNIETGGERPELGAMSEWAADYLLNGTPSSLNAIRQQAEIAASEWPFYLSDLGTNASINYKSDLAHYRTFVSLAPYGGYYQAAYQNRNGWDFHESDSHFQIHPYTVFALTEDAYFAEACQYLVQYGSGSSGAMLGREGNPTSSHGGYGWGDLLGVPNGTGGVNGFATMCSNYAETRTVGNGIRNLAMAYKTAPVSPPLWLLPRGYYAAVSSDYSKVIDVLWTQNPLTTWSVFRMLAIDPYYQAFEQSYGLIGMALADLFGMPVGASPSWFNTLTFYFGMIDGLTNGTSGWNRQTPQIHDYRRNGTEPPFVVMDSQASWADLNTTVGPTFKNGTFPTAASPGNQQGGSMTNCAVMYAACACAQSRGVAAAPAALSWMSTFIDYNYPNNADASMGIAFFMRCGFSGLTLTFSPALPLSIPNWTPKGAIVTKVTVQIAGFAGTLQFVAPNFDDGGRFALSQIDATNWWLIVNPSGPGVGADGGSTDNITLQAFP